MSRTKLELAVEKAFLHDLQVLLDDYHAEIEIADDCEPHGQHVGEARVVARSGEVTSYFILPSYMKYGKDQTDA